MRVDAAVVDESGEPLSVVDHHLRAAEFVRGVGVVHVHVGDNADPNEVGIRAERAERDDDNQEWNNQCDTQSLHRWDLPESMIESKPSNGDAREQGVALRHANG